MKTDLLPAALLSEGPIAQVVAACMLDRSLPTFNDKTVSYDRGSNKYRFNSKAHKRPRFDLTRFYRWLKKELIGVRDGDDGEAEYSKEDWTAATLIANCVVVDLCCKDCTTEHADIRLYMQSTYLPLASQTQFVESVVKEAKLAVSTDRSEQIGLV